jgi:hypothetical protein
MVEIAVPEVPRLVRSHVSRRAAQGRGAGGVTAAPSIGNDRRSLLADGSASEPN